MTLPTLIGDSLPRKRDVTLPPPSIMGGSGITANGGECSTDDRSQHTTTTTISASHVVHDAVMNNNYQQPWQHQQLPSPPLSPSQEPSFISLLLQQRQPRQLTPQHIRDSPPHRMTGWYIPPQPPPPTQPASPMRVFSIPGTPIPTEIHDRPDARELDTLVRLREMGQSIAVSEALAIMRTEELDRDGDKSKLPKAATDLLKLWVIAKKNPYPTREEKEELCRQTDLTKIQLRNWFTNLRKRHFLPVIKNGVAPRSNIDFFLLKSAGSMLAKDLSNTIPSAMSMYTYGSSASTKSVIMPPHRNHRRHGKRRATIVTDSEDEGDDDEDYGDEVSNYVDPVDDDEDDDSIRHKSTKNKKKKMRNAMV